MSRETPVLIPLQPPGYSVQFTIIQNGQTKMVNLTAKRLRPVFFTVIFKPRETFVSRGWDITLYIFNNFITMKFPTVDKNKNIILTKEKARERERAEREREIEKKAEKKRGRDRQIYIQSAKNICNLNY